MTSLVGSGKTATDRRVTHAKRGTVTDQCPDCGGQAGLRDGAMVAHTSPRTGKACTGRGRYPLTARTVTPVEDDTLAARRRGNWARRAILPHAIRWVAAVREEDRDALKRRLAELSPEEKDALIVTLACMVPDDVPVSDLLAWITFGDDGRPLPAVNLGRAA